MSKPVMFKDAVMTKYSWMNPHVLVYLDLKDNTGKVTQFGFPRSATDEIRGIAFSTMPGRTVLMSQWQDAWREIWMDGRELPKNVGSDEKDSPDPRYYGYSVGHWEGDDTLVINTTGVDDRTWLSGESSRRPRRQRPQKQSEAVLGGARGTRHFEPIGTLRERHA